MKDGWRTSGLKYENLKYLQNPPKRQQVAGCLVVNVNL